MTLAIGFIIAIIAGWIVPDGRRAAAVTVVPYLAVLAGQTWLLAVGDGNSAPSAVNKFPDATGYWVINIAFLAITMGIAAMLGALLGRRTQVQTGRRAAIASAVLIFAAAVLDVGTVVTATPVAVHTADNPPWWGLLGMGLTFVLLIGLGIVTIKNRVSDARANRDLVKTR
jgi:hypothetical protein